MRALSKGIFGILIAFCLLSGVSGIFFGCTPKDVPEISISVAKNLTVQLDAKTKLEYNVNPKQSLATFKAENDNIFTLFRENNEVFVKGLAVGVSKLTLSVVYGQKSAVAQVEIVVKPKTQNPPNSGDNNNPTNPDNPSNPKDPDENPDIKDPNPDVNTPDKPIPDEGNANTEEKFYDAGSKIYAECEFGGTAEKSCLTVSNKNAGFAFVINFNYTDIKIFATVGEREVEIPSGQIYFLPDLEVEEYFLTIELVEAGSCKKYRKVFKVIYQA